MRPNESPNFSSYLILDPKDLICQWWSDPACGNYEGVVVAGVTNRFLTTTEIIELRERSMRDGIYTLANDVVFDQMVALLNSIEVHAGKDFPVCVIAYDDRLDRVKEDIKHRANVTLLDDKEILTRWREFCVKLWHTHPHALETWKKRGIDGIHLLNHHRRYAAFDAQAPFDRFIYLDADTLLLGSPQIIFDSLDNHDFVVYDFQFKDPSHVFDVKSPRLYKVFSEETIQTQIFCSGCYASKRGLFSSEQLDHVIAKLAGGEADVLYLNATDQSALNYMALSLGIPVYNLARHLPETQKTGNSVTSPHFEEQDHVLYDRGKRLTYLHYIGLSSKLFRDICSGINVEFPYRDIFLHYRYLREPEKRPNLVGKPLVSAVPKASLKQRVLRKLGLSV